MFNYEEHEEIIILMLGLFSNREEEEGGKIRERVQL